MIMKKANDRTIQNVIKKVMLAYWNAVKCLNISRKHYYCKAIFAGSQIALLSDGTVVCSCFDDIKRMPIGNIKTEGLCEIWRGGGN